MFKTTGTNSWCILDNKRDTTNPVDRYLLDGNDVEGTSGPPISYQMVLNYEIPASATGSGVTYIYTLSRITLYSYQS